MLQQHLISQEYLPFSLGRVTCSEGVKRLIDHGIIDVAALLKRHTSGDWGDIDQFDYYLNQHSLIEGGRIISEYNLVPASSDRVWVATEEDRLRTSILLAYEF